MKDVDFEKHQENCPCYTDSGQCFLQVSYNQHVNDPRYGSCIKHNCPIIFWVDALVWDQANGG